MNERGPYAPPDVGQERRIVEDWLAGFNTALVREDRHEVENLLAEDGYWRDVLAHQWDFRSMKGRSAIAAALVEQGRAGGVRGFSIHPNYSPPQFVARSGRRVVEAFLAFRTGLGSGSGVVRLEGGSDGAYRAWGLMTSLQSLDSYPEAIGKNRPERIAVRAEGENWLDRLAQDGNFDTDEPEVMIVGAGHCGLMIGARLKAMGVRALIVDSLPRIGDGWRNRYHTLQLHNEIESLEFPYLSYPKTWPTYLPKDMFAAWLEFYALATELSVWTSVRFERANRREEDGCWTASLRMPDGSERVLCPKHIVMASGGVSGRKYYPQLPGLDSFSGIVAHSADVRPTDEYRGKRVIVVGTSTSGHDIALELTQRGCDVTMVQRSPTNVVSIEPSGLIYAIYKEGRSIDEIDVVSIANNFDALIASYREFSRVVTEMDKDLLAGLARVGFLTDPGYMGGGYFANYLHRAGGYYLNVGASDCLIDGRIKLIQNDNIAGYESTGARLRDGSMLEADVVVLATGYLNQEADLREHFGDAVADAVGKVWGWDEGGELRRCWRPSGQNGLWLQLGGMPQSRTYSKFLAIQIVAELRGLK